jgi:hypothetical protein
MLTRAQFVTQLQAIDRFIYLGAPSPIRKQSSMLPVVNAVNAFALAPTGPNLLLIIQAIGGLAAAKKTKYANALTALYNSFPAITVTTPPFACHIGNVPNGIGVAFSAAVPSHQTDAVLALRQLDTIAPGQALLQAICQK